MGVLESIKRVVGDDDSGRDATTYRCTECGVTFESFLDEDDFILSCEECDSKQVEPA